MTADRGAFRQAAKITIADANNREVMRTRRNVDMTGLDRIVIGSLGYRHRALPIQPFGKSRVNFGGICWVISVGGQSAGIPINKALSASTPPVDAPTKMILPAR